MIVCMKDRYGVPSNMFGVVPDDFYAIVGRVIMLATQVEYRVLALLWALDRQQPQDVHAGKPARELLNECRSRLHGHDQAIRDAAGDCSPEYRPHSTNAMRSRTACGRPRA